MADPVATRRVVAAAQIACRPGDIAGNLALHERMIAAASERGVDLLVFPELSLTDYESQPDMRALARPAHCAELASLARLAPAMTVAVGFIELNPAGRPYNACALLAGGRVVHVHRKLNLPTYGALVEGHHYTAGVALDLAETPLGRVACLICADTWNPALPWLAALAGAEMLAVPVASARNAVAAEFDAHENWLVNLRHTAMTYGLPLVMTNHCGRRGQLDFWDGSAILDAFGRVVAEAGSEPALLSATLDHADTLTARSRLPTMRDAAPELVRALLASTSPRLARADAA